MRPILIAALMLAAPALATPPGNVSPMSLPNGGGYMQPGNPNRGITAVGRESPMVRQREPVRAIECNSRGGIRRCPVRNAGVTLDRKLGKASCRQGRDWLSDARSITVTHGCRASFRYRARS